MIKAFIICTVFLIAFGAGYHFHNVKTSPSPEAKLLYDAIVVAESHLDGVRYFQDCQNDYWVRTMSTNIHRLKHATTMLEQFDPRLHASIEYKDTLTQFEKILFMKALDERDEEQVKPLERQDFGSLPCMSLYRELFPNSTQNLSKLIPQSYSRCCIPTDWLETSWLSSAKETMKGPEWRDVMRESPKIYEKAKQLYGKVEWHIADGEIKVKRRGEKHTSAIHNYRVSPGRGIEIIYDDGLVNWIERTPPGFCVHSGSSFIARECFIEL